MSLLRAQACWVTEPGSAELRELKLKPPGPGEALVRTLYTALSKGTEALVFAGRVPASERARMRAPFQEGEFPGPVKYGYINVGRVEQGPPSLLGQLVFSLFPHQSAFVVPVDALTPLADGLDPKRAVLLAGMETALNALWDAEPKVGDRIRVVGGGVIGCLCAYLAGRIAGCHVQLIDSNPQRQVIAKALGVDFALPENAGAGADLVLHASGTEAGLQCALGLAGVEARVVELSWFGDELVFLPLGAAFHSLRLQLVSSQVGTLPAGQRSRWSHARRLECAMDLLQDATLECLISGESEFSELPATLETVLHASETLCHRIRYPGTLPGA